MEPSRRTSCAIMSPRRAAHSERWADTAVGGAHRAPGLDRRRKGAALLRPPICLRSMAIPPRGPVTIRYVVGFLTNVRLRREGGADALGRAVVGTWWSA